MITPKQLSFVAITTCDNADQNCPYIPDAIERFHLPYNDPQTSDNTDLTEETYLKVSKQIAGELFLFSKKFIKIILATLLYSCHKVYF